MPLLYENKSDTEIQLMKDWAEVRQYVEKHFENKPDNIIEIATKATEDSIALVVIGYSFPFLIEIRIEK